jgi:uncharacterized protein YgbK (DUF1537 family)
MSKYVRNGKSGAVIVGSHAKKTTEQLEKLLEIPSTEPVEIDVSLLLKHIDSTSLLNEILQRIELVYANGKTPVIYTSRKELEFEDINTRLDFGKRVSQLLMDIVQGLPKDIGFLISKGGITSNDVLSTGLALPTARLLGQVLAGCSVVITPKDHFLFPNLPVVLFPGNVGNAEALAIVYSRLSS